MKQVAKRTQSIEDSIFAIMSKMALEHDAINLAQGFPDFDGADFIKNAAKTAIDQGKNQYASFAGITELRTQVASYRKEFYNNQYNPITEVSITNGATEAIFSTIMALVDPGDEVIVFEPFYDSYLTCITLAQAKAVPVTLHTPDFKFRSEELIKAVSSKTKLIILNNPHNPSGKIFSEQELHTIAQVAIEFDLYVLSDEVYEFLLFDNNQHISIANNAGMNERTISISSAGKIFGMTGWKIGWALANEEVSTAIRKIRQYSTFSVCTPMQHAVASALQSLNNFLPDYQKQYQLKRDLFCAGLKNLGFEFELPQATYFVFVPINGKTDSTANDYARYLIEKYRVAALPPDAFYLKSKQGNSYLRFCFAKQDSTLQEAIKRLANI